MSATLLGLAALVPLQFGGLAMTSGELFLALEQLASPIRVLYVAAHPDDENSHLLAYLEKERHVRAAYLSLTRGGGGQNLVGAEQGDTLGMMRTHELLGARSVDGAEQYFSRARDFGYSKSAEESISYWGHETTLRDVVRVVRTFRPHVIITRFPEHGQTHGHHLASARLAHEAFAVAGREDCFVDQLETLEPWAPERLLFNGRHWTGDGAPGEARRTFVVDTGGYSAVLGESFGELAARSRSHHASQGFGAAGSRVRTSERLYLLEGDVSGDDPLAGLRSEWDLSPSARAALAAIEAARASYDALNPGASVPALVRALVAVRSMEDGPFRADKETTLTQLIAAAAGLFVDARTDVDRVAPGQALALTLEARARGAAADEAAATLRSVTVYAGETRIADLSVGQQALQEAQVTIPARLPYSVPYWLSERGGGSYRVDDLRLVGSPLGPPPLHARFVVDVGGEELELLREIRHVWGDRVRGERSTRVVITPALTITSDEVVEVVASGQSRALSFTLRASRAVRGTLRFPTAAGFRVEPQAVALTFTRPGETQHVVVRVHADGGAARLNVQPMIDVEGSPPERAMREVRIDHDHIPTLTFFQPASLRLAAIDAAPYEGRIAYLQGAGDLVPASLRQLGIQVDELSFSELQSEPLEGYAAVVLGVRAYNTMPSLRDLQPKLFAYVESGGVLLTQYNTNSWFGRLGDTSVGPHEMTISRDRVTNERAAVEIGDDEVLRSPNAISERDFNAWVQERGLYFASEWSDEYRTPLRIADPNEAPSEGSLLISDVGRGRFVYTGLSFFRQLPAGVPGAYRLFLNLITP